MTPKILTPEECSAIEARAAKATEGPWEVWDGCSWRRIGSVATDKPVMLPIKAISDGHPDIQARREDLEFACDARADIPNLLATIAHLRSEIVRKDAALSEALVAASRFLCVSCGHRHQDYVASFVCPACGVKAMGNKHFSTPEHKDFDAVRAALAPKEPSCKS